MAHPTALVFLAEGFEDIEAVSVIDVLRRGGVDVIVAAVSDSLRVRSAHGIEMSADVCVAQIDKALFGAVILPGGMPGTENLARSAHVIDIVRRHASEGRLVCAICAAPTVLAAAGVLPPEVHVTCYPSCSVDLDRPCAGVPVVCDGNFITGQAPGSALLFALVVLQALTDESVAHQTASAMVTDVLLG